MTNDKKFQTTGWLDDKLKGFRWYKNWRAKQSRKRLAKEGVTGEVKYDEVESYSPTDVIEKENERRNKTLLARDAAFQKIADEQLKNKKIWALVDAEIAANPPDLTQLEKHLQKVNDTKRFSDFSPEYKREIAESYYSHDVFIRIYNERYPKEG